jgi:hypothetical protein
MRRTHQSRLLLRPLSLDARQLGHELGGVVVVRVRVRVVAVVSLFQARAADAKKRSHAPVAVLLLRLPLALVPPVLLLLVRVVRVRVVPVQLRRLLEDLAPLGRRLVLAAVLNCAGDRTCREGREACRLALLVLRHALRRRQLRAQVTPRDVARGRLARLPELELGVRGQRELGDLLRAGLGLAAHCRVPCWAVGLGHVVRWVRMEWIVSGWISKSKMAQLETTKVANDPTW